MVNRKTRFANNKTANRFTLNRTAAALLGALPFLFTPALAETYVWEGTEDNDIRNPNNWSGGSGPLPGYEDDVIINGANDALWQLNIENDTDWSVNSLKIGDAGQGKFSINTGAVEYSNLSAGSIVVGGNGGNGQLDIDFSEGGRSLRFGGGRTGQDSLDIGVGQNSVGTVNVLGRGKTSDTQYYQADLQSESGINIRIGADGGTGTVNLNGASWAATGYIYDDIDPILIGTGAGSTGTVNVLAGGKFATGFSSSSDRTSIIVGQDGGSGTINVSGRSDASDIESRATFGSSLTLGDGLNSNGQMNILSGGKVISTALPDWDDPDNSAQKSAVLGTNQGAGHALVSGEGSTWYAGGFTYFGSGDLENAKTGHLYVGDGGEGSITLADGGKLIVGKVAVGHIEQIDDEGNYTYTYGITGSDSSGNVYLANQAGSKGTLTFGGAIGQAPTAAGSLEAAGIVFGDGDGTVAFNHTEDDFQFNTAISGHGTLANYAGTSWVTQDNSAFSGNTALYGGTLGVTNDHALGDSHINVLGNATLAYANGVTIANAGTIQDGAVLNTLVATGEQAEQRGELDGLGMLNKTGEGELRLTAANTYSGQTIISQGTLALVGSGSIEQSSRVVADGVFDVSGATATANIQSLAGSGTVELGGQNLILTNAADQFDGKLSGSGVFALNSGMELLTGDSSGFAGTSKVNGGTLAVNGVLAGPIDVYQGGTLAGTGQVGETTVHDGGTIIPGMPGFNPATLTVNGNLTLSGDATYAVDITPTLVVGDAMPAALRAYADELRAAQANDLITVNGTTSLNNASVSVVKAGGIYLPGSRWKIVSADNGLSGQFGSLTESLDMPFVNLQYDYDANNAYLQIMRNDQSLCQPGMSANQCNTGNELDNLGDDSLLGGLVASQVSVDDAGRALNLLSGEIYASAKGVMLEDSRFLREAVNNRLISAAGGVAAADASTINGVWMHGFGSWGKMDGDSNAAKVERDIGGVFFGGDRQVTDNWRVGALGGYSRSNFDVSARNSSGHSDSYHAGVYAGAAWEKLALRTGLGFSWHDISTDRTVNFTGYYDRLSSDYHASTTQLFGELGYQLDAGPVKLEPFVNAAYVHLRSNSFAEQGDIGALRGDADSSDLTYTTLGTRASHQMTLNNGAQMKLWGSIGWQHAFGDVTPTSTARFAGGNLFTVNGAPLARDVATIEAGLETSLTRTLSAGAIYSGQFGSGVNDNGVKIYLNWKF